MKRIQQFLAQSPADRALLLRAFFWLVWIRIGLGLLPLRTVRRWAMGARGKADAPYSVSRVAWAVRAASRYVPDALCLPQALACQALLARYGHASRMEIGIITGDHIQLDAHAWVVCGGRIVIGESGVERYTPFAAWEE